MVDLTCTRKYGFDRLKINAQLGFKSFYIPFMNFTDSDDEVQEGVAK